MQSPLLNFELNFLKTHNKEQRDILQELNLIILVIEKHSGDPKLRPSFWRHRILTKSGYMFLTCYCDRFKEYNYHGYIPIIVGNISIFYSRIDLEGVRTRL